MLIDWFTVVAQIVNFLILLALLHRFLYKPMLKTIDKRQDQLESRWQSAADEKEKAQAEAQKHRQAQQDIDRQREEILAAARDNAEAIRRTELKQAREEVAQKRQEWQEALKNEQDSAMAELHQQIGQQVMAITQRILQDLAHAELDQQAVETFQRRLYDLDDETHQSLVQAFGDNGKPITVQTGRELPESSREALRQTLRDRSLLNGQPLHFEVSPDLIFGIRLKNDAHDLAWSARDYLRDLETAIATPP